MEAQVNFKEMKDMLLKLQAQVDKLQKDFDDSRLSEDDLEALKLAEEEHKKGETISHEELKKELEL